MRDSKIIIRVFYFIFLSALFSYLTFISVHANTNDQNITIGQYEGEQSTSKSLNINANLIEIGAIEFEIYYDSNSFQVSSVSLSSVVRGEFNSINYSEPGVIKISLISSEGLTLKGRFMTVDFNVKSNATIGNHFWYVAVGTATNIDFEHQTIKATHGSFLVKERIYVAPNVYIYSSVSNNELEIGQVFSINFYSYNLYDMATGTFKFYYDNEYFKYNNTVFSTTLQNENSLIDINANQSGYINISYASLEGINYANPMFTIYFEVIKDTNVTSQIEFNAENLYNESLEPLNFIGTNLFSFKIREKTIEDEHSLVYLTSYVGLIKDEIFVNVKIEKDSMLAAGDFTILYDDSLLNIIEIDINDNLSANELLYTHIDYKNGSIKFSYINTNKLIDEITFITIKAKSKVDYSFETSLTVQGSGLKDEKFNNLNLGFLGSNVNLTKGYNIAFYDINDNLIYSEYLTENTLIDEPILNDVLGYRFIGWDKEFNKASEDLEIRPLYQLIDYQINYIDIEGSINNNPNSYTIIDEITLSNPVKEGYTFIGWYDEDNNKITIISGNGNKEVRAAFEINRYEIKYYVDGMLYEEVNYDYNEEVISIATPIKEGYHFLGWDKEIPVNMPADNLEISGNFKINTYEVRFIDYDGSVLKEQIIDWNESAIAPDEPNNQEGYHFVSWDTNFMNVKETLEVKAIYEINFYEVNFYDYDGSLVSSQSIAWNHDAVLPNDPKRTGYTFIKWNKANTSIKENTNLSAIYNINEYHLTYYVDGEAYQSDVYNFESKITLISNPIKPGHTFSGWQDVFSVMPASDVEINGYFTINKYRVTFKDIHGEVIYSEEVNWNHPATSITAPVEEGYDFIAFDKDISKITSDLEVNLIYQAITRQITYQDELGVVLSIQRYKYPTLTNAPDEPLKEGYRFIQWQKDGVVFEFGKTLHEDVILVPAFEINRYEINYQIDENITHNNPLTYTINNSIIYLNNPSEKAGYNFIGWHDGENKLITSINPKILKDVNLYAKFELKAPKITLLGNKTINYGQALNISINVTHELSYTYETKWFKDGILISNDKELELLQVNESGSYQALVKIIINDTEINRNVDFNVNINRVKLDVSYENNEFTYNGLEHLFEAVIIGVIEGDDVSLLVSNNNKTDAETYTATLSLEGVDKDNYYLTTSQVIFRIKKAEVNINKDEIYLNINSKDINIESSYLNLSYKINDLIYEGNLITNLNENSRYLITIFIKESSNYLQSNELIFDVKTYLSFETLNNMFDENNVITIDTFYLINDIKEKISLLKDNDQVLINVKLSELINNYNVYIDYVNKEYEEIENFNNNIIKIVVAASSFTLMSLGFVLTIVRRKIIW